MLAAALVVLSACANPFAGQAKSPILTLPTPSSTATPTPSPSPTPTAPLAISAPSFKVGEVAAVYPATAFSATGGVKPYQWTVSGGALPDGLNIGADGSINGTPTNAGTYKFTIQVADAGTSTAAASGSILIRPAITASYVPACATTCNVEQGCVTVCGAFGTVGGGVGPYSYSIISGTAPVGTTLAPNALTLKGTFTATGNGQFTAIVTDGYGETATLSPDFLVYPHISLSSSTADCSYSTTPNRQPCNTTLTYTGGVPGSATLQVDAWKGAQACGIGSVPQICPQPTISGSGSGGTVNITISFPTGYPAGGSGTFTVHITDQGLCAQGTRCASGQATVTWHVN